MITHRRYDHDNETVHWHCPGCNSEHWVAVKGGGPNTSWSWNGNLEKPTLSPSVNDRHITRDGRVLKVCHVFIRDGMIEFLSDCTHALVGQTVPVP